MKRLFLMLCASAYGAFALAADLRPEVSNKVSLVFAGDMVLDDAAGEMIRAGGDPLSGFAADFKAAFRRLARNPNRVLGTIQLGITLAGYLASATAAITLAEPLVPSLGFLGGTSS